MKKYRPLRFLCHSHNLSIWALGTDCRTTTAHQREHSGVPIPHVAACLHITPQLPRSSTSPAAHFMRSERWYLKCFPYLDSNWDSFKHTAPTQLTASFGKGVHFWTEGRKPCVFTNIEEGRFNLQKTINTSQLPCSPGEKLPSSPDRQQQFWLREEYGPKI